MFDTPASWPQSEPAVARYSATEQLRALPKAELRAKINLVTGRHMGVAFADLLRRLSANGPREGVLGWEGGENPPLSVEDQRLLATTVFKRELGEDHIRCSAIRFGNAHRAHTAGRDWHRDGTNMPGENIELMLATVQFNAGGEECAVFPTRVAATVTASGEVRTYHAAPAVPQRTQKISPELYLWSNSPAVFFRFNLVSGPPPPYRFLPTAGEQFLGHEQDLVGMRLPRYVGLDPGEAVSMAWDI